MGRGALAAKRKGIKTKTDYQAYVILCPKKLSHIILVTFNKTQFDFKSSNVSIVITERRN